ncbi:hypothetical protein [Actinophytocola oryzae]|uniref:hypothetical protein n=1 Tax=Actinophytocola oryzae TaxID=502181 RepID=UPI0014152E44|nr:hypothetical protein [Actinophytocola oryzae]
MRFGRVSSWLPLCGGATWSPTTPTGPRISTVDKPDDSVAPYSAGRRRTAVNAIGTSS